MFSCVDLETKGVVFLLMDVPSFQKEDPIKRSCNQIHRLGMGSPEHMLSYRGWLRRLNSKNKYVVFVIIEASKLCFFNFFCQLAIFSCSK